MHSAKAKILLLLWMVVLTASVVGVWYLLSIENKKVADNAQSQVNEVRNQVNDVSGKVNKIETSFDDFNSRLSGQLDSVNALQEKIDENDSGSKKVIELITSIKMELDKFRKDYDSKIDSLQGDIGAINAKVDNYSKNVNLGEVSVVKEAAASTAVTVEVPVVPTTANAVSVAPDSANATLTTTKSVKK